jgi:hypothetical protein
MSRHEPLLDVVRYGREKGHLIDSDLLFAVNETHREVVLVQENVDDALTVHDNARQCRQCRRRADSIPFRAAGNSKGQKR